MCRYALHSAKTHYACLSCRFTAKHPGWLDGQPRCPHCAEPMVDMGKDFKAPRHLAVAQWRKVRLLAAAGLTFDSCGCRGPGPRPRTLAEAKTQLGRRRTHQKRWT